jgi:hypothetical protein
MKIRAAVTTLLAAAAIPAASFAAQITVWQNYDFGGGSTTFTSATASMPSGWNDSISSLRVDSGTWEVCRDNNYANCRVLGPGTSQLARLDSGWNDSISSLRPVSDTTSALDAQTVAQRLYVALLGREADPEGLRNATSQIASGRTNDLVRTITSSPEFASVKQSHSSAELLDQIYRGLLGRPADTAANTAYQRRLDNGDVAGVVSDLLASNEFANVQGSPSTAVAAQTTGEDNRTRGRGNGVVVHGNRNRVDTINSVKVLLGGDGRFRLTFNGSAPQQLEGTYTREGADFARINTVDTPSGTLPANGGITLNQDFLERLDVEAGTPGTNTYVAYNFTVDNFAMPQEETACQQAVRERIQKDRGRGTKVAFLNQTPRGNRQQLRGKVVILADNSTAQYTCQVDRHGQVLSASVQ